MDDEIINLTCYHGTEINRANRMLDAKAMEQSIGDRHWLGDGSYFFKDDFYAFKWIKDMYKKLYKCDYTISEELFKSYIIIEGSLVIEKSRIFNLDNPRHRILFDQVLLNCNNKQEYSE